MIDFWEDFQLLSLDDVEEPHQTQMLKQLQLSWPSPPTVPISLLKQTHLELKFARCPGVSKVSSHQCHISEDPKTVMSAEPRHCWS